MINLLHYGKIYEFHAVYTDLSVYTIKISYKKQKQVIY